VKVLIEDYSMLTGYVDKHDQISTSYSMSRTQDKEVLLPTYLVIVDAVIIHKFCGQTVTHEKPRERLIKDLILWFYDQNITASGFTCGKPSAVATYLSRLEMKHSMR
jgi:hypothetical protein